MDAKPSIKDRIAAALQSSILDMRPLHGGSIHQVYRAKTADGAEVVAKVGSPTARLEAKMLCYLKDHSSLPVPQVRYDDDTLLVMDYIEGDSRFGNAEQAHAAELIAELHSITAEQYGFEYDTVIGALHQPNPQTEQWIPFFRDHRLLHMGEKALSEGAISGKLYGRIESLAVKLDALLIEPERPALLHGDLWTTNILAHNGRITGLIDPAIYYGHPEIELAFSTLFGTFGTPFFQRYQALRPLEPGFFETRRDLYNLYPLLVHVRLFGGSYVHSVEAILRRFGV